MMISAARVDQLVVRAVSAHLAGSGQEIAQTKINIERTEMKNNFICNTK
jgi:hypothetical protein